MKFIDEFREPTQVKQLLIQIQHLIAQTNFSAKKPLHIMEVCGGHTHAIYKFGLEKLLPPQIEFIHGPGCPVCVLPMGRIDNCVEIAQQKNVIFCTFGDAIRVPGRNGSLLQARQKGADVRIIYSPLDALTLAMKSPEKQIVLFGLGFETTMPAIALTLKQAKAKKLKNFSLFCQHITIIPTLRTLLEQPDISIDAFIAPGHVTMVIGLESYHFISQHYHKPVVVSGFEPTDILQSIVMILSQIIRHQPKVENQYKRVVPDEGNALARAAINDVFTLRGDNEWRGLGVIADSGVRLNPNYSEFDAEKRFDLHKQSIADNPNSRCGDVLTGRCKPINCTLFGKQCTPDSAYGALMVSSEGACAAYYQYRQREHI